MSRYKIPKILWIKKYFDTGIGLTSYFRWFLYTFGLTSQNVKWTMILALIYGFSAFFIGWIWIKMDWFEKEAEINNQLNKFQREVRETLRTFKQR